MPPRTETGRSPLAGELEAPPLLVHGQLAASPKQYAPTKLGVVRQARTFVLYGLKRPWRDGTSAISFDPLTFIEQLAALVPPPRAHQLTYHGVLAPASAWRDLIVPRHTTAPAAHSHGTLAPNSPTAPSSCARSRSSRSSWAELLRRVFAVDVLTCPHCGGRAA